jgi:hypothetical protein
MQNYPQNNSNYTPKKYIFLPKVASPYSVFHPLHTIQVLTQLIHQQWWVKTYNKELKKVSDVRHNQSKSTFITIWNHSNHGKLVIFPSYECQGTI